MLVLPVFSAILCLSSALPTTTSTTETLGNFTLDYDGLVALKDNPDYLLIDVRQPSEWVTDGFIPGAINIPSDSLIYVLTNFSNEAFILKYGRDKPDFDSNIIFSCRTGVRSARAQKYANELGYTRVYNYALGIQDWNQHQK